NEPRRCRGAFPQPEDGRVPPDTRLPQTQHPLPRRTRPAFLLRARARDAWCGLVPGCSRPRPRYGGWRRLGRAPESTCKVAHFRGTLTLFPSAGCGRFLLAGYMGATSLPQRVRVLSIARTPRVGGG